MTAAALRAAAARSSPASARPSWTPSPSGRSARPAPSRPSRATSATRPRSAPRSTTQIVHGIPSPQQVLRDGDVLSDRLRRDRARLARRLGADRAVGTSGPVGPYSEEDLAGLLRACELALWHGLAQAAPGRRLTDISHAVEQAARGRWPVRDRPGVHRPRHRHARCTWTRRCRTTAGRAAARCSAEGMALAIEPMLVLGGPQTRLLDDDWTVVTAGRQLGRALRAHGRDHRRRTLGADGRGRRRGRRSPRCGPGSSRAEPEQARGTAGSRCRGTRWHMTRISGRRTTTGTGRRRCCASTTRPAG